MNDREILNLWRKLDSGESVRDVVSDVKGKSGYGRERTLRRYAQVLQGFKEELESEIIEKKTGLSVKLIDRLRNLWEQKHQKEIQDRQKPGGKILLEEEPGNRRALRRIVRRWRRELKTFSPVQLLQEWLEKAHEDAITRFYTNEDAEMLYSKARERHGQPLQSKPFLQVENDPTFELLQQRFPTSDIWTALNAWHNRIALYIQAFYGILKEIEHLAVGAWDAVSAEMVKKGIKGVDWIDCVNFTGFEKRCKLERLLTVFVTCDLLAGGIAECPTDSYWARLTNDLEKLRLRMNVALSTATDISPKGGWISGIADLHAMSPDRLLEFTREFLGELAKLRSAEDSLIKCLKKFEEQNLNAGVEG